MTRLPMSEVGNPMTVGKAHDRAAIQRWVRNMDSDRRFVRVSQLRIMTEPLGPDWIVVVDGKPQTVTYWLDSACGISFRAYLLFLRRMIALGAMTAADVDRAEAEEKRRIVQLVRDYRNAGGEFWMRPEQSGLDSLLEVFGCL